jgi:urea transport system ATP-binding protein
MLAVEKLNVFYGESHILRSLDFGVASGESLAVMGRNGMGKSTLLKSLIGTVPVRSGAIHLNHTDITKFESYNRVRAGLGYVPQGRLIFPYLTVEENILAGMDQIANATVPDYVYESFPVLLEMRGRRGGNLSGGQQQQLAIARALVSNPKILILDEPTDGIQPSIIKEIAKTLNRLRVERQFALIVSEQVLSFALNVADRFIIMERGHFVHEESRATVNEARIARYLTI